MKKLIQFLSYIFAAVSTFLGAACLFSFFNLKSRLFEIANVNTNELYSEFDNAFIINYLMFGCFAFTSLSAIICLLFLVIGKSESVKFVYVEKSNPQWVNNPISPNTYNAPSIEKNHLAQILLDQIQSNFERNNTQGTYGYDYSIFIAICEITNAAAGVCYLPTADEKSLVHTHNFAIKESMVKQKRIPVTNGLIGQAVTDLEHKIFNSVPANYFNIEMGMGTVIPGSLLIFPFFNPQTNKCTMVLELAYFSELNPAVITALKEINPQISVNLVPLKAQA
jgi:hypothetical protein